MARYLDQAGRPIVAVTGIGVVTSLGIGTQDNWRKLTAGESGVRTIARFATEGLKTRIAGAIDFVAAEPLSTPELSERLAVLAVEEAIAKAAIGAHGNFPGPLFLAVPPIELEWPQRRALTEVSGANGNITYHDLMRRADAGGFEQVYERFLFGSVADGLADRFGTKGSPISLSTACASGTSAIQLGVEAIRRGEAEATLCVATDGSVNPEALVRFSLLSEPSVATQSVASASPRRM